MFGHQIYAADQIVLGVVLVSVMKDIMLPLFLSGMVTTLFGVGILVGSMLAGWIVQGRGFRFTASFGILCFSIFTLLTGFSTSAWDISLYRVAMGIGEGIWNVAYYSIIGTLFAEKRGFASAIAGNMYILGILWAYPLTSIILVWSGSWRLPLQIFGMLGLFALAIILLTLKPLVSAASTMREATDDNNRSFLRDRNVLLSCFMGLFNSLVFYSIASFYPTYLMSGLGYDPILSSALMSMQTWSMFITAPVLLYLSDRHGRKPFIYFASLSTAFIVYFMFHLAGSSFATASIACLAYGVANCGGFPMILAFVQDSVGKEKIASVTGIYNIAFYTGTIAAGPVTGFIISTLGWEATGIWLASCSLLYFLAATIAKQKP
jgi:MFS family permease